MSNDNDHSDKPARRRLGTGTYRTPPLEHRFKPGQSGNPSGRRKGSVSLKTIIKQVLNTKQSYRVGDKTMVATKGELMMETLVNMGLQKNLKAIELVMNMDEPQGDNDNAPDETLPPDDQEILDHYIRSQQSEIARPERASCWSPGADDRDWRCWFDCTGGFHFEMPSFDAATAEAVRSEVARWMTARRADGGDCTLRELDAYVSETIGRLRPSSGPEEAGS